MLRPDILRYNQEKEPDAYDDSRILERRKNFKYMSILVERLEEVEPFIRLAFSPSRKLREYLILHQDYQDYMAAASKDLTEILASSTEAGDAPERSVFMVAFDHMKRTNGFSMIQFLMANDRFERALDGHMDNIETIYSDYLVFKTQMQSQKRALMEKEKNLEDEPLKKRPRSE